MNENNTNPNTGEKNSSDGGKYFTQDQVNQIISKRLAEEKAKADSSVQPPEERPHIRLLFCFHAVDAEDGEERAEAGDDHGGDDETIRCQQLIQFEGL